MHHSQLISLAQSLGHSSIREGLCKGFSISWIQAVCCGKVSSFYRRLKFLEKFAGNPKKLVLLIQQARESVKKGIKLSEEQQLLLEIPVFFEGIALVLNPEIGYELFGGKILSQHNSIEILKYIQSKKLEKLGGLKQVFHTNDQFTQTQLENHLKAIASELKDKPNVAVEFSSILHSVGARVVGENQFELVDTNDLSKIGKYYTSEELTKELDNAFNNSVLNWILKQFRLGWIQDWFIKSKPLVLSTSIFTNNNNPLNLDVLRKKSSIISLVADRNNFTLLHHAAKNNDIDTLRRIDFSKIDINQYAGTCEGIFDNRTTALNIATIRDCNEAVDYLLTLPGLDVNKISNGLSPIFCALINKNYKLAKKISQNQTFDLAKNTYDLGNLLHCLAATAIPNATNEVLDFAQYLIDLKVAINQKNSLGNTPIFDACAAGNFKLAQLFLKNGAKVDEKNSETFNTLLHEAALKGNNVDLIQYLLNNGLNCNQVNANNETPLHLAVLSGSKEAVERLIANGADCDILNNQGLRPLDLACKYNQKQLIPALLTKTTLVRKDLYSNSSLVQLINNCSNKVQKDFLKKALETYVSDRKAGPNFLNCFNLGIHKEKKVAAAQELLNAINGLTVDLRLYYTELNNGLLSSLYGLYNKITSLPPLNQSSINLLFSANRTTIESSSITQASNHINKLKLI